MPHLSLTVCAALCSLITQEVGAVTMRVMSRPGRITQPGHIMTIVRNVVSAEAVNAIGRVRMLDNRKAQMQVSLAVSSEEGAAPRTLWASGESADM